MDPKTKNNAPHVKNNNNEAIGEGSVDTLTPIDLMPQLKPKRSKERIIHVAAAMVIVALGVLVFLWQNSFFTSKATQSNHHTVALAKPNRNLKYDSPIGLLPPFQKQGIRSGKFKLTSSYATGQPRTSKGSFSVDSSGRVSFKMIPDISKANKLLKYLSIKDDKSAPVLTADSNFRYDFQSLLGYSYIYAKPNPYLLWGSYEPTAKGAKSPISKYLTSGAACNNALDKLEAHTSFHALNVADLSVKTTQQGAKTVASFDQKQLKLADQSVINFFSECYKSDSSQSMPNQLAQRLKNNPTQPPDITYWQDKTKPSHWHMIITTGSGDSKNKLEFEAWNLSSKITKPSGSTGSYLLPANKYSLAYSLCRVVPVVYSGFAASYDYEFMAEDMFYGPPSQLDTGYSCTTEQVPIGYQGRDNVTLKLPKSLTIVDSKDVVSTLAAQHDLAYLIEQYYAQHHSYPGTNELNNLLPKLGRLASTGQTALAKNHMSYLPTPSGCTTDCTSYSLRVHTIDPKSNKPLNLVRGPYNK